MKERVYYRLVLELKSALSIGSADSVQTDNDVVLDSRGKPLLPATSLAGLYRSFFDEVHALKIFGEVVEYERKELLKGCPEHERGQILGEDGHRYDESAVRVYDGTWTEGNDTVSVRDNVALKDKVAISKLKFDRQAVQAGAKFVTYIEIVDTDRCACDDIEKVIAAIHSGQLRLGSKSTRGYGRLEVCDCRCRVFKKAVDDWLEFNMFDSSSWLRATDITERVIAAPQSHGIELRLTLELQGGISIRGYTTKPSGEGEASPDYGQLIVHGKKDEKGNDVPVIPGTSWAGAFRDRYEQLAGPDKTRELFGYVDSNRGKGNQPGEGGVVALDGGQSKPKSSKSRICFDESVLTGGEWKVLTRNAIDRFTGGTINGALYTERTYFGGTTELVIRVNPKGLDTPENYFSPLVCAVADLHNGFLAVGGLTSVGRGLFKITKAELSVDGKKLEDFQTEPRKKPAGIGDGCTLIAPDVQKVAKIICSKDGERS